VVSFHVLAAVIDGVEAPTGTQWIGLDGPQRLDGIEKRKFLTLDVDELITRS
jgi:hypothetical protein